MWSVTLPPISACNQALPPISACGQALPPIVTHSTFHNFTLNTYLPSQDTELIPLEQFLNTYKKPYNLSKRKPCLKYTNRLLPVTNQMGLRKFLFLVLLFELNFKQCQQTILKLLGYTVTSENSESTQTCKYWIKEAHQALMTLERPINLHKLFVDYSYLIKCFSPQQPQFFQQPSHLEASIQVKKLLGRFGFNDSNSNFDQF